MSQALLVAIIQNDIETALYETGDLLKTGGIEQLESTWIRILGVLGECVRLHHVAEFQACIMKVEEVINNSTDDIDVSDSFLLTTRLAIFASKFDNLYARPNLAKMKDRIKEMFPDTGSLNEAGMSTYRRILPPQDSEERVFIIRILAGLAKLWSEEDYDASRLAFEYLSRKKFPVPKPKWIMTQLLDDNDIIWILWGAILLYKPDNLLVATSFKLFCTHFKKQAKGERIGLLWASFYHTSCSYKAGDTFWTKEDKHIYNHVSSKVRDLWGQMNPTPPPAEKKVGCVEDWINYFPRGSVCQITSVPHIKEEPRMLKIKGSSVKDETRREPQDETSCFDSGHRRFYLGE